MDNLNGDHRQVYMGNYIILIVLEYNKGRSMFLMFRSLSDSKEYINTLFAL